MKSFGATQALRGASLGLREGEVTALVGENGSGKSTLVKILSGVQRPDAGATRVGGRAMDLRSPARALAAGIATVYQEVLVVEPRSVVENLWLGAEGIFRNGPRAATKRAEAERVLAELLDAPPALDTPVEALSLSDRQCCSIARALLRDPKVLILDEATSALDIRSRNRLFDALRRLTASGGAVLFISHRMDEIEEIADRCTVMRSGETVATLERAEASPERLIELMTGEDARHAARGRERVRVPSGEPPLRADAVVLRPHDAPIDLIVQPGERVGLAGLEGHGQDAFLRALWGGPIAAGAITRGGSPITSPLHAVQQGIAYVPRERRAEALFEGKSIRENFGMATLRHDVSAGLLRPRRTSERLARYTERLGIKLGDPADLVTTLSGGTQQKVVVARWLATGPRVLLLNDPTRGIDLRSKRDLYALFDELSDSGVSIVLLSTELEEHIELLDRVLVFREHAVVDELTGPRLTRQSLLAGFFGTGPA
jgi:ABC-type sugar transport system ATPase subunit